MTVPTLQDAVESLNRRKRAAGAHEPIHGPALSASLPVLAGTDLDPDELAVFSTLNAKRGLALTLALGTMEASAALWTDGLLTGLEFDRLRDETERPGPRIRALVGALETVKRILGELPYPTVAHCDGAVVPHPSAAAILRALGVIDLMLEGEAEDANS